MPDGHGCMDQGGPYGRSRWADPPDPGDRSPRRACLGARRADSSEVGQRPELVSRAILKWMVDEGIETALIAPGKPWQNGACENFNGKFRDECLNLEWFRSRSEAKVVIEAGRRHYHEVRPHSSLGYLKPAEFVASRRSTIAAPTNATGRDAAVYEAFAPRPVAQPLRQGHIEKAVLVAHPK